jgi:hypothetical protein
MVMLLPGDGNSIETSRMDTIRLSSTLAAGCRRAALGVALCGATLALAGCGTMLAHTYAASVFSRQNVCPSDRMIVRAIPVRPEAVFVAAPPPADVASDPGRLRVWERDQRADFKSFDELTYVAVSGCGQRQGYLCWQVPSTEYNVVETACPLTASTTPAGTLFHGYTLRRGLWEILDAQAH